ncbi:hypothetical protein [Stappia sp. ES.058]|uniref:hypothetical protein n=1 Tax=Stappia sp. ES.058 TaxID=1881061 RepID=UPI000B809FED|nr:hypothetical protein [Stappia sp. ES.058]
MPGIVEDLSVQASSTRPALILPGNKSSPENPETAAPADAHSPFPARPDVAPLGPAGNRLRIPGVTGATVARIASAIGCEIPRDTGLSGGSLSVAPLNCIARELGIDLKSQDDRARAKTLNKIEQILDWQDDSARKSGMAQPFTHPYRKSFGRLSATFTSNIYHRIGACPEAVVRWRIPDGIRKGLSQDRIAAGHTAPLSAYLFTERDIRGMLASSNVQIRSPTLPHAVCTGKRPARVAIRIEMGDRELTAFDVPADDFFQGGAAWMAFITAAATKLTKEANDVIRQGAGRAYADAERFRDLYGDFKNMRLMTALIDGTYKPKAFLPAHQLAVRRMFVRYHVLYSRHCYDDPPGDLSPEDRARLLGDRFFLSRTFVYTSRNARTGEDVATPQDFHIRVRYADRVYDLAQEELRRTHNALFLERGMGISARALRDIDLFFERQGCLSPRAASFEENLFQAASLAWDPQRERGTAPQIFLPGINLK